jgi:hypothetical protein
MGMDLDAHVRVFCKAIQANGENNDANIIEICFILMPYQSGEFFIHPQ